jgi:hypothetical protein
MAKLFSVSGGTNRNSFCLAKAGFHGMKKLFFNICFFFFSISAFSQDTNKNLYSGGMLFFQPGYMITENDYQNIRHLDFGIGGILRFYFYEYFTAGIYGGSQRTNYHSSDSKNSYVSIGYGGPVLGFSKKTGKLRYTASAFIGKATIRNLHIESQNNYMLVDAHFYKHSTLIYSPVLSIDYALSQRLLLTLQTVCLTAKPDNKSFYNPTIQFGILFNR